MIHSLKTYLTGCFFLLATIVMAQERVTTINDIDDDAVSLSILPADSIVIDSVFTISWQERVKQELELLLQSEMFQTSQVGLMVYDLTADSVLFRHNERQLMRPASIQKVVTSVAALDYLGSNYELSTRLCYTGEISNGILYGDIYCVGAMDPLLSTDDLRTFASSVKSLGIDTIRGKVIADLSMKDANRLGEGWCWDDKNPCLTPLLIDGKDVFMQRFLTQLERAGIFVDGFSVEDTLPYGAIQICQSSHTVSDVMVSMMKNSDNLFAEALFYQIASRQGGRQSTAKNAAKVIKNLIKKIGLNADNYKIADGSGLSLYNYHTAELEVELLKYAWKNADIFFPLYESLPIAGVDGTLKKRMKNTKAYDNVRAKTGTVTAVSSLSGYCKASNGHELCFCIINNGLLSTSSGRSFQDNVCNILCE